MIAPKRTGVAEPLKWHRAVATAISILVIIYGGYAIWRNFFDPPGVDFVSYWAAGRLALDGQAGLAYDIQAHRAMELTAGKVGGLMPFPYPPPFLFVVAPFALAPFVPALALWLLTTTLFYVVAVRRFTPSQYALAVPGAVPNMLIGQNGFLTTGIMASGLSLMVTRPWLGGAVLGLLVIKPQLALILPIALLAGREWRAIGGAAASAVVALVAAALVFGLPAYRGFFGILPEYAGFLRDSRLPWTELASPFAAFRHLGVSQGPALGLHVAAATFAIIVTWRSWARKSERRAEVLAAATVLIPPYLFTYDSLLLALPLGWMIRTKRAGQAALVWTLCFLPVAGLAGFYPGPNTVPLAAILCLGFLHLKPKPEPAADRSRLLAST